MTQNDPIIKKYEERLKSRLDIPQSDYRGCILKSPYSWWLEHSIPWQMNKERKPIPLTIKPTRSAISNLLRTAFGHIVANPSKSGTKNALESNYVFAEHNPLRVEYHKSFKSEILLPNTEKTSAKSFLLTNLADEAIRAADRYRATKLGTASPCHDISSEKVQSNEYKWFMFGDRGVGKTIFMNYMLTMHSRDLNKKRVIWTRIDLTKESPPGITIPQWVRWKICSTLFQYYDAQSYSQAIIKYKKSTHEYRMWRNKQNRKMIFDLSYNNVSLFKWAKQLDLALTIDTFKKQYRKFELKYRSDIHKEPDCIEEMYEAWFVDAIWNHVVVDQECSFIIFFDGLDQLGLSKNDKERFVNLRDQLTSFLTNEYYIPSSCLITMREHSFKEILRNQSFRSGTKMAEIMEVPAEEIFDQRVSHLKKSKHFSDRHPISKHFNEDQVADFCKAYLKFCTWCLTTTVIDKFGKFQKPTDDIAVGFKILEDLYGNNRRKLFGALIKSVIFFLNRLPDEFEQMLQFVIEGDNYRYYRNISGMSRNDPYSNIKKWYYLFIEALMLGDIYEPFRKERYVYTITSGRNGDKIEPVHFIDSESSLVFNAFHYPNHPTQAQIVGCLLPIRLLQYARTINSGFHINDFVDWICKHFRYKNETVVQIIDEMIEAGIFKYKPDEYPIVSNLLIMSDQGKFILQRLVASLEYISLAQQTCALPTVLVDAGLFPIRPYRSPQFVLFNKIISATNFVRVLREIEETEEEYFNEQAKDQGYSFRNFEGADFQIVNQLERGVEKGVKRIIGGFRRDDPRGLLSRLENVLQEDKYWQKG